MESVMLVLEQWDLMYEIATFMWAVYPAGVCFMPCITHLFVASTRIFASPFAPDCK